MNAQPISVVFRSGMSRANDFRGARDARVPIGVVVGELTTTQMLMSLPRYLESGVPVFADSGAFSCAESDEHMDWSNVMRRYLTIAEMTAATHTGNLYLVAPDVVGDQAATLALLTAWAPQIRQLVALGCQLIIPLQTGKLPAQQLLDEACRILDTTRLVAGIPSNRAAMSIDECASLRHHAFHILGRVQPDDDQMARCDALLRANPSAIITADANWLRSRMKSVCQLAEQTRQLNVRERTDWRQITCRPHHRAAAITRLLGEDDWGCFPQRHPVPSATEVAS